MTILDCLLVMSRDHVQFLSSKTCPRKKNTNTSRQDSSDPSSDDFSSPEAKPGKIPAKDKKKNVKEDNSSSSASSSSDEEPPPKKVSKSNKKSSDNNGKSKSSKDVADDLPVTFNEYYRHKCKLASLKSGKLITGQVNETCSASYRRA